MVAYVCGQRNDKTCTDLRCCIPTEYFNLATCSDYWSSYAEVFDPDTHPSVGKHTGLSNHVERFNASLRNRLGPFYTKNVELFQKQRKSRSSLAYVLLKYNQDMKNKYLTRRT